MYTPVASAPAIPSSITTGQAQQYPLPTGQAQSYQLPTSPTQQYMLPMTQAQSYPVSSTLAQQFTMPTTPVQNCSVPYNTANTSPPPTQPLGDVNFQQFVIHTLQSLDKRLNKLDTIETQISSLSQKISNMDGRVSSLENNVYAQKVQLAEFEASRAFDSQTCDELKSCQSAINKQLTEIATGNKNLSKQQASLQTVNARLSEDILDIQSRSMRDNLLFFNFTEVGTADGRSNEDCTTKILDFCETTLQMNDATENIKIDRAHRIGRYNSDKQRPIVVKFNYHQDKLSVKRKAYELLKNSTYGVGDQFPKVIQDRRRKLVPLMIKAKNEGKRAVLSYDKLYINNVMVTADSIPEPEPEAMS